MHYIFVSLILSLFIGSSFANDHEVIIATGTKQAFDLSGRDGYDGKDGHDAFPLDCSDGRTRNGRNGEDGGNGEKGENGLDAYIFFSDPSELALITLDQTGGKGGAAGAPGKGTNGCHGGLPGKIGKTGEVGKQGDFGSIFLINDDAQFEKESPVQILSLENFYLAPISLSRHEWNKRIGSQALFAQDSKVHNEYYEYDKTVEYNVRVLWNAITPIHSFNNTRVAIGLTNKGLELTVYSGAVLDYRVHREGSGYLVEVVNAITPSELQNLKLGKIRSFGEDLILEVKESYSSAIEIDTRFVLSLYEVIEKRGHRKEKFIGQYKVDNELVIEENEIFYLLIGNLNFPREFKAKGTKLRIYLSVYREAIRQTRVFGLKGLYKI